MKQELADGAVFLDLCADVFDCSFEKSTKLWWSMRSLRVLAPDGCQNKACVTATAQFAP